MYIDVSLIYLKEVLNLRINFVIVIVIVMYINIIILNNFVPNKNTLKSKGSIDKFSISSSRTEMISLSSEVAVDIFIRFIYI